MRILFPPAHLPFIICLIIGITPFIHMSNWCTASIPKMNWILPTISVMRSPAYVAVVIAFFNFFASRTGIGYELEALEHKRLN